eukprot:CAMPEP_0185908248 /NCGR_PEP_ID=MMETSP0196C-20130402/8481_1 /TAXON_ID=2932 /ORGANISM="Alexandrium fundyense, Strain CCMP1719" /LENGTH=42 /DNA_ID= /DNA_START= /DNA_END= /DNA_ORIENTATION=
MATAGDPGFLVRAIADDAGNSAEELFASHSNALKDGRTLGFP